MRWTRSIAISGASPSAIPQAVRTISTSGARCRPSPYGHGAAQQHPSLRDLADEADQLTDRAGLADPRLAADHDRRRAAALGDVEAGAHEAGDFGLAADERRLVAEPELTRTGRAQRHELVGGDWLAFSLEP